MKLLLFTVCFFYTATFCFAEQVKPMIDLLHVWKTKEERHALNVFRDVLIDKVIWADGATKIRRINNQDTFADMASVGAAPAAFLLESSSTSVKKLYESGLLAAIENLREDYIENIIPEIRDSIRIGDKILVMPIAVHTFHSVIYNKALMEKYGLKKAETWGELLSYGEVLNADGISLIASSDQFWQLRTLIRAVLSSYFTREELLDLVNDEQDADFEKYLPALQKTYHVIAKLKEYSLHDTEDFTWFDAASDVRNGKAFAQILGDFIFPLYPDKENYPCALTPESRFISWGFDSFGISKTTDPDTIAGQALFVQAVTDADLLSAYLRRKSGLPVLNGIGPEDLDDCDRANFIAWKTRPTLDTNRLITNRSLSLFMEISNFWASTPATTPRQAAEHTIRVLAAG